MKAELLTKLVEELEPQAPAGHPEIVQAQEMLDVLSKKFQSHPEAHKHLQDACAALASASQAAMGAANASLSAPSSPPAEPPKM